jgi:CheY-like chemotaxis protein
MQIRDAPERMGAPSSRPGSGGLILLVEDDFVLRSSLSELLNSEGFRVDCCADGRDAFRRLHMPPKPDLILLDIMLPHLDGFELRALQQKSPPPIANIPVVVISAYDLDPQSVDDLGLSAPFRKPLDVDKLLQRIRDLTTTMGPGGAPL